MFRSDIMRVCGPFKFLSLFIDCGMQIKWQGYDEYKTIYKSVLVNNELITTYISTWLIAINLTFELDAMLK